ncbi:MAG: (4Fe-4S)-binding protein [Oscillospiraceae bacterium]
MYTDTLLTADEVKKAARNFGADIVGIGSIDRWRDVPAAYNPTSMMSRAKSVICIGFRIHRGTLRGKQEGNYYSAYTLSGFNDINKVIAPMAQRNLASFIEDCGYEALPVMYYAHNITGNRGTVPTIENPCNEIKPDVFFDFRLGSVLCGVGEIGYSRLVLTPDFGPAQRLYFIVTEAKLDEDDIISGICDNCMECVRKCPAKALDSQKTDNYELKNIITVNRSKINTTKCSLAHISGALSKFAPDEVKEYALNIINGTDSLTADGKPYPSAEEIKFNVTDKVSYAVNSKTQFNSPSGLCGDGCVHACLAHLDKVGKLTRKFNSKF